MSKIALSVALALALIGTAQAQVSPRAHQLKGEARQVRDASRSTQPAPTKQPAPASRPSVDNPSNAPAAPASAVHRSAASGNTEAVKAEVSSNPKAVERKDSEGFTPLHVAAAGGHLDTVQYLLTSGTVLNAQGSRGETALYLAAGAGKPEIVEALLKAGADTKLATKEGRTPLHKAAMEGDLGSVKALLASGADPKTTDGQGRTPLDLAERYKKGEQASSVISELIKAR